jgi:tetratricopeptide (TPR) repeat protein
MSDDSSLSTPALERKAIDAALNCKWQQALELNLEIIKQEPNSVECLNRLAKSYFELGNLKDSQKFYKEVLDLDPYNSIAQKNLKKIALFKETGNSVTSNHHSTLSAAFFVSEPGITKSVTLIKVAEPQRLMSLSPGISVNLVMKNRGISVVDMDNKYLGVLPDDIAFHLMKLIKGGNKYSAFIQSVKQNGLIILVREVFRSKKFKNQASFLDDAKVLSFSSDHISLLADDEDTPTADLISEADEGG